MENSFSSYEIDNLEVLPLLFQTGYLTINNYEAETAIYTLDYPNFEVRAAFLSQLSKVYSEIKDIDPRIYPLDMVKALKENDFESFFGILKNFFANIPYHLNVDREKYYQTIFYLIFRMFALNIEAEVQTNKGRIDAVLELENAIYIFEFKLNGTKEEALAQIKEKGYYEKYCCDCRDAPPGRLYGTDNSNSIIQNPKNCHPGSGPGSTLTENIKSNISVYLIGVEFDNKERNVGEWVVEEL